MLITEDDIKKLLTYISQTTYSACSPDVAGSEVLQNCIELMKLDYELITVSNTSGELSAAYPRYIVIPNPESDPDSWETPFDYSAIKDTVQLKEMILKCQTARCRSRFPVPVILYKGRYICRSATLSGTPEVYGRSGINYVLYGSGAEQEEDAVAAVASSSSSPSLCTTDWNLVDRRRQHDIKLLKALNVETIIDLMVENKKVKYGFKVSSSEKVDKQKRYGGFNILSLPYPGCEFFKIFKSNNYSGIGLRFNWEQTFCDAILNVPNSSLIESLMINWDQYKEWDLVLMTQNYMKVMLRYLHERTQSLLVHCISGWDRTPLFISMLRLSLWADGVIHKQLNAQQILYLTIGYDWFLFGHQLPSRLHKGEDIFYFCFYMLKHLTRGEYSIIGQRACGHRKRDKPPPLADIPALQFDTSSEYTDVTSLQSSLSMTISQSSTTSIPGRVDIEPLTIPSSLEGSEEEEIEGEGDSKLESGASSGWQFLNDSHSTSSSSGHNTSYDDDMTSSQGSVCTVVAGTSRQMDDIVEESDEILFLDNEMIEPKMDSGSESDDEDNPRLKCRKIRLNEVRLLFNTCYSATIMETPRDDGTFSARLGSLAERVGLTTPKTI